MRYPKEHKDKAKQRLLAGSARHAKKHGFAASGVDTLANAAGVTSGSVYKHFDSKSDLFAAMLQAELARTARRFTNVAPGDVEAAGKALTAYLSTEHLRHPETGCPLPAFAAEVARADNTVRAAFDEGLRGVHAELERVLGSRDRAWALIAQNVGAVLLARAALDAGLRRELLDAASVEARAVLERAAPDR